MNIAIHNKPLRFFDIQALIWPVAEISPGGALVQQYIGRPLLNDSGTLLCKDPFLRGRGRAQTITRSR